MKCFCKEAYFRNTLRRKTKTPTCVINKADTTSNVTQHIIGKLEKNQPSLFSEVDLCSIENPGYSLQPTAYSLQPTAYNPSPTAHNPQSTARSEDRPAAERPGAGWRWLWTKKTAVLHHVALNSGDDNETHARWCVCPPPPHSCRSWRSRTRGT